MIFHLHFNIIKNVKIVTRPPIISGVGLGIFLPHTTPKLNPCRLALKINEWALFLLSTVDSLKKS